MYEIILGTSFKCGGCGTDIAKIISTTHKWPEGQGDYFVCYCGHCMTWESPGKWRSVGPGELSNDRLHLTAERVEAMRAELVSEGKTLTHVNPI